MRFLSFPIAAEHREQQPLMAWNRLGPTVSYAPMLVDGCHPFRRPTGRRDARHARRATKIHVAVAAHVAPRADAYPGSDFDRIAAVDRNTTE